MIEKQINNKIRKVFLDELPKKGKSIDWSNSKNYEVHFAYNEIKGILKIIDVYKTNKNDTMLTVLYNNKKYDIFTGNFKKGAIGAIIGKITSEFKIEIGTRFKEDKRDITIIARKKEKDENGIERKYYKYHCNVCGFDCSEHYKKGEFKEEHWVSESSIANGTGCSCCCPTPRITVSKINSIYVKAEWMIPIVGKDFALSHTCYCGEYIHPTCPDCGNVRDKSIKVGHIYETHSMGCERCGDGVKYPNKFAFNILNQLNITFEAEYNPEWIKPRRYDFYFEINNKKYILEMDGGFHTKDNTKSGQTKEESKTIDDYKDNLAIEHGIKVIRIDCDYENEDRFQYIKKSVLNSRLNNLFDLNIIDWVAIEKYSLSNLVKVACDYKKNNPDMTTTDISIIMGYNSNTICSWLKKGTEVGWCNYNAEEELRKNGEKLGKYCCKPIMCIETEKIFESATECERISLEVFGIKLWQDKISAVCNGKRESTKGFTFKFIK